MYKDDEKNASIQQSNQLNVKGIMNPFIYQVLKILWDICVNFLSLFCHLKNKCSPRKLMCRFILQSNNIKKLTMTLSKHFCEIKII